MNKIIRKYGLIGYPLSHSFSRMYFGEKFSKESLNNFSYDNYELDTIEKFPQLIKGERDLKGLNVTIPYKESVIPYLDDLDETAQKVGAVNVIKIQAGKLKGYNSDLFGFKTSIKRFLEHSGLKAMVLGTGGASKAVTAALDELEITWRSVSRKPVGDAISYREASRVLGEYKLLVNTTPLGMSPKIDHKPDLDYSLLTEQHYLFDLIYNPEITRFLQAGKNKGAKIKNGLEMLELQAERSWEIWNS